MTLVDDPDALIWKRQQLGIALSPITCEFDHVEGRFVLVRWPEARMPTQAEVDAWQAEFQTAKPDMSADAALDESKALKAAVAWTADKLGIPLAQARAEIKAIYNSR